MALIELRDISKIFENGELTTSVLKGVNLDIQKGEFACIMGASGSGKSTLMYILGLLDRQTNGIYSLDGRDISSFDDDGLSNLRAKYFGFVFQSFYLVPYLTVLENVLLPSFYDKGSQKSVEELKAHGREILTSLGLGDRIDFEVDKLSGGQKQRVAIARALMNSPEVILADEPTGQLDAKSGESVMEIFERLNEEGKTIILVTHDQKTASYAKRKILIRDGAVDES